MGYGKKKLPISKMHVVVICILALFGATLLGYLDLSTFAKLEVKEKEEFRQITLNLPLTGKILNEFNSTAVTEAAIEVIDPATGDILDSCTSSSTSGSEGVWETNLSFLSGEKFQVKITNSTWNTRIYDITVPHAFSYEQTKHDCGIQRLSWRDEASDEIGDYAEDFSEQTTLDITSLSGSQELMTIKIQNSADDSALGVIPFHDASDDTGYLADITNLLIVKIEDNATNSGGGEASKVRFGDASWERMEVSADEVWWYKEFTDTEGRVARDVDSAGNPIKGLTGILTVTENIDFSSVSAYTEGTEILEMTITYAQTSIPYLQHYYTLPTGYSIADTTIITY